MLSSFAVHSVGYLAVLVVLAATGDVIHLEHIPLALALLVPYLALAVGFGAMLAAMQVVMRDVEHGLASLLIFLFYATPILYPAALVPPWLQGWMRVNPFAHLSGRLRDVLLLGQGLHARDLLLLLAALAAMAVGLYVFERLAPHFEDFF